MAGVVLAVGMQEGEGDGEEEEEEKGGKAEERHDDALLSRRRVCFCVAGPGEETTTTRHDKPAAFGGCCRGWCRKELMRRGRLCDNRCVMLVHFKSRTNRTRPGRWPLLA